MHTYFNVFVYYFNVRSQLGNWRLYWESIAPKLASLYLLTRGFIAAASFRMGVTLHFSPDSAASACFKMSNTFNVLLPYILSYSQKQPRQKKKMVQYHLLGNCILIHEIQSCPGAVGAVTQHHRSASLSQEKAKA